MFRRLKASELERARVRSRLQALKEKITELENIIKDMSDENEKLRKTGEKVEMFKSSITRKDTLINSLKAQINRLTAEYDILKASENNQQTDAEKKIR